MPKIVINTSFDQFCISHKAFLRLRELGQAEALKEDDPGAYWSLEDAAREPGLNRHGQLIPRDDERLVCVVEELREQANGQSAQLRVVSIPDGVQWQIAKEHGREHVSEVHRIWK